MVVNLLDENDNSPTFALSQYIVRGVPESVVSGTDIVQVRAVDVDSLANAQLTYSVSDDSFSVLSYRNVGYVKTARELDFDFTPMHTYNFTVFATDNGRPPRTGSATVRVTVTNVNDEAPLFAQHLQQVHVSEDAHDTVVHVVQAHDPDGDHVTYSFTGRRQVSGPFRIDEQTGILSLVRHLEPEREEFHLEVVATDDGSCCAGVSSNSATGVVIVKVKDVNNNTPRFVDCERYNPIVDERQSVNTVVMQVSN